jgi:AcrR family transcriptional regulator
MAKRPAKRDHYHHGDLERALIEAGLAIVERKGVEALSLRGVARRVKVSHAAPYYHFANKSDLLAAVAAAGFDRLVETIRQQETLVDVNDPIDRLRAVGRGYVLFAVIHPSVFRLMFRPELTHPAEHPRLMDAEARAFATLMATMIAIQQRGLIRGSDPRPPAAFAWSTVHGLALLHIDEVFNETPLGQVRFEQLAADINETIISGLRAHPWS